MSELIKFQWRKPAPPIRLQWRGPAGTTQIVAAGVGHSTAGPIAVVVGPIGSRGQPGAKGDDGADGKSAYQVAVANGFVGSQTEWLDSLVGTNGNNGSDGADGKSAYEVAQDFGFEGSEEDWLASLNGKGLSITGTLSDSSELPVVGEAGEAFIIDGELWIWNTSTEVFDNQGAFVGPPGPAGTNGTNGKSAYQIALDNGFVGSEAEWLLSLKGADGDGGELTTYSDTPPVDPVDKQRWIDTNDFSESIYYAAANAWVILNDNSSPAVPNAGDIEFTPVGTIAATDVQTAIAEIAAEALTLENVDDRVSTLLVAGNGFTATYDDTGNTLTLTPKVRYTGAHSGKPAASFKQMLGQAPRAGNFSPAASNAHSLVASTAAKVASIYKFSPAGAAVLMGTLSWAAAGKIATVAFAGTTAFAANDGFYIEWPVSQDTTLADITFLISEA